MFPDAYRKPVRLGNNIRCLRKKEKMSQGDLAEKVGVTAMAISRWERGEADPLLPQLIKIADRFGKTLDEMVYGEEV